MLKSKLFSSINVFGLSVGMTCCMLLLLYILSELSFDQHHKNAADLYLLRAENVQASGEKMDNPRAPSPYARAVKDEFPEVIATTRVWQNFMEDKILLKVEEAGKTVRSFYETKGTNVDPVFFDMFSYQFSEGDPHTALNDPHSIVLSEEVAAKLFGKAPYLNKRLRVGGRTGNNEVFSVTGVYKDEAHRSHIDARYFVSMQAGWIGDYLRESQQDFTNNNMFYTYLQLKPGTSAEKFGQKLPSFIEKYARKDLRVAGFEKKLFLLPVTDIHLFNTIESIITPTTSTTYLYILGSIAIFTLLIACINFMNLATARSAKRAAEVGMRKVMGAARGGLVGQFLGESMVLTFMALLLAFAFVALCLPFFNQLADKTLYISDLLQPGIVAAFILLALLTGLLAGSYPAFFLSLFNPLDVIKGKFVNSASGTALRRGLVVFQFVISIGLVVGATVIQRQIQFMRDQPLGFNKDQQIVIPFRSKESRQTYAALRNELLSNNQITAAAGTSYYPGILNPSDMKVYLPGGSAESDELVKTNWVAPEFMKTMGFQPVAGRMFSNEFPGDTNMKIVVNEATLRKFAIPTEKAIGQKLYFDDRFESKQEGLEIVGVVKDFHFADMHQVIEPYAFFLQGNNNYNYLIAHVNTKDLSTVLPFIESKWKTLSRDEPFSYTFLNEDFAKNYAADARTGRIVNAFTIISIFISCLGLFGLAAFAAQQRVKEIGVRKVLGASVANIVGLLSRDFVKLILISILIATPLTWYLMNQWLKDFAYRIDIQWWMFAAAGAMLILIALLTISTQAIKAAIMNPVKSLRSE